MKQTIFLLFMIICGSGAFCQTNNYWQQQTDYNIKVSLNDTAHTLDGELQLRYQNNSPDTLRFIWFHLWPNAYKNDRTAFSDQLLENGNTAFYFSDEKDRGYINRLAFKVNELSAEAEDHPQHQDIVKVLLPQPLAPGASANITTPFHVKLPFRFSRGGFDKNSFMITQWYPKPAVYDRKGWHEMPYLDQGEFYSEFGNFDVEITVPSGYVIAATGNAQPEKIFQDKKTVVYQQNNIHDFAWFADKNFIVKHDTMQLASKQIDVYAYYLPADEKDWEKSIDYIKSSIKTKSEWLGEYPYDVVSVVDDAGNGTGGGMEYPTITIVESSHNKQALDFVINHEVGHNWFYGILATNERRHAWMDEGMNSYYDYRYSREKYNNVDFGSSDTSSAFIKKRIPADFQHTMLETVTGLKKDQPIETPAASFSDINYALIAYTKTAEWMQVLEQKIGKATFDSAMKTYYERWKFKHPYPEDFKKVMEEVSGQNLDATFALLNQKGSLQAKQKKDIRFTTFFNLKETEKHNYVSFAPAIGYNSYDKFMAGLIISNYSMPLPKLRFAVAPLYAFGSKQFNGIGQISYHSYFDKKINHVAITVGGARFSTRQSLDTTGKKIFENFYKVVPSVQLYFRHDPRSTKSSWIDLRSYIIGEQKFDVNSYAVIAGSDSTVSYPNATKTAMRYVNQVSFNIEDHRVLYPYDAQLQFQQGKGFYRVNLNANYFFNYAKGGGMNVRLFAAKFGYLGDGDINAFMYQPKLLAATGDEDYTYSNYFIGRTASTANAEQPVKNAGLGAQQIMIRDGGLKMRFDQSYYLQGRSEDWVAALNFNTTIPDIFPIKLPVRLFFDVGSYAEGWKKDALTSKVLYVGGLQLSLFKNILNVYAPLIYSKDFRDNLKTFPEQNKFGKRLTFSIDVQNIKLSKLIPSLSL